LDGKVNIVVEISFDFKPLFGARYRILREFLKLLIIHGIGTASGIIARRSLFFYLLI
jgi:hypothetical protein